MQAWRPDERTAALARSFDARALGEARLLTVGDGPGVGQRLVQLSNADGVELEIAVDRGFDLSRLRYRGVSIGWLGPTDYPAPITSDAEDGLGGLRAFDGFLVTGGLDHHGLPTKGDATHLRYSNRASIHYPLHGRISATPARLVSVERDIASDQPSLVCIGVVRQASLFGGVLELRRTITLPLLGGPIRLQDRVTNLSHRIARHAMLYHFNVGYPLLDVGSELSGLECPAGWLLCDGPTTSDQQAESFELAYPVREDNVEIALRNAGNPGIEFTLGYRRSQLPAFGLWRAYEAGIFALGLEPHTLLGRADLPLEEGGVDVLSAGESRTYDIQISLQPSCPTTA